MSEIDRHSIFPVRKYVVFCLIIVFALAGNIKAAGGLDRTFGGGGIAFARVGTTTIGRDLAVQADGKIVVVGYTPFAGGGEQIDFAVARFNPNGALDTSFGIGGKVITPIGSSLDIADAVAIQADGKIIVAGMTRVGIRDDFSLVRYNTDGSLDATFDGDGKVITSIGAGDDFGRAIVIQPDGKIIVVGDSQPVENSSRYFAAARYNTDGSLDTTFDGDGKVTTFLRNAPDHDAAYDVALQPDGKILLAGTSFPGLNQDNDFALVRYNSDGSLDTTFDGDGKLTTSVSPTNSFDYAYGIALQPDGKIVVAGGVNYSLWNDDCVVLRYNADGSLDTSFDGDGKVYISFGHLLEAFFDVAIQTDGKIVAAGYKSNNSGSPTGGDITVARLDPNGSLDTTFNGNGKVITQLPPYGSRAASMKIQPNGKIIAAGSITAESDAEFMVARYMVDTRTVDFDGDGKTDVSIFRPLNNQWWISRSSDNSNLALTFGVSNDRFVPADYTGDGKSDVAIFRPSGAEWFILRSEDFSFYAFPFGLKGDRPVPADYDGDGIADPAVFRASTGTWYINVSSTGGTIVQNFGTSGDRLVPADYDGDGKTDLAIYRLTSNSEWWVKRSSNGSVFVVTTTGVFPINLCPGDYTGDGKADFAYVSGAGDAWSYIRSEDLSTVTVLFGAINDSPVPGDYDGDGRFDIASFRPSTNTWRVLRSSDGGLFEQTFGANGDLALPYYFVR